MNTYGVYGISIKICLLWFNWQTPNLWNLSFQMEEVSTAATRVTCKVCFMFMAYYVSSHKESWSRPDMDNVFFISRPYRSPIILCKTTHISTESMTYKRSNVVAQWKILHLLSRNSEVHSTYFRALAVNHVLNC